jgi:hypothetical protein
MPPGLFFPASQRSGIHFWSTLDHETISRLMLNSISFHLPSSVDGVTEAQLTGLAENVIRVDVAD